MTEQTHPFIHKLRSVFQLNKHQLQFGSYAAELSFYILWAFIPLLLCLANVISILPVSHHTILDEISRALPTEVRSLVIPIITSYIKSANPTTIIVALIIAIWPASNIFNTVQRILNTIYKAKPRRNMMVARGFAYLFTLGIISMVGLFILVIVFGQTSLDLLEKTFHIELSLFRSIIESSGLIGLVCLSLMMFMIYLFVPNVKWRWRYALPGTVVSVIGFVLISQLYSLYLSLFGGRITSNQTIGMFIVLMIWLYFNSMVIAVGGYINVFVYDYIHKSHSQPKVIDTISKDKEDEEDDFND